MKREDVEAFIELAEKATEGPWEHIDYPCGQYVTSHGVTMDCRHHTLDAEFIAQSSTIAPQLAREWLKMREALEWYAVREHYTFAACEEEGFTSVFEDYGDCARQALAEIEGDA